MVKCKKCGHKTVLAMHTIGSFGPDQEPYEDGVIEDAEACEIFAEVSIGIHYCEKCCKINDVWIEDPEQLANATLILLAPELLSSLKDMVEEYQNSVPYNRHNAAKLEQAGNVIARADGKE